MRTPAIQFKIACAAVNEWEEFEQHFLLRRVALGTCHRPYATPCVHEHACVKCRFLQVDPAQAGRLEDMTNNAQERLVEAREHHWLGDVSALEESLVHLRRRRDEAKPNIAEVTQVRSTSCDLEQKPILPGNASLA